MLSHDSCAPVDSAGVTLITNMISCCISMNPAFLSTQWAMWLSPTINASGISPSCVMHWQISLKHSRLRPFPLNSWRTYRFASSPWAHCSTQPTGFSGLQVWNTATLWNFLIRVSNSASVLSLPLASVCGQWSATNTVCWGNSFPRKNPSGQVLLRWSKAKNEPTHCKTT